MNLWGRLERLEEKKSVAIDTVPKTVDIEFVHATERDKDNQPSVVQRLHVDISELKRTKPGKDLREE